MNQLPRLMPAVLECAAVWLVLRTTLPPAGGRWARWGGTALYAAVYVLAGPLAALLLPQGAWREAAQGALSVLAGLVYACAAYEGRARRKVLAVAAVFALLLVTTVQVEWMGVHVFGMYTMLYPSYDRGVSVPVAGILSRCFALALCMAYGQERQTRRELEPLRGAELAAVVLFPLVGLACVSNLIWTQARSHGGLGPSAGTMWMLCALLLAAEGALVLAAAWTYRAASLQRKYRQELERHQLDYSQAEELRQMVSSQRMQTHEYRNRLTVLSMLLAQGQYAQAEDFLQQLTQYTYQDSPTVQTNHPIADAVLNLKYAQAREQRTAMRFVVGDLSGLPFTDDEVVKLLGNLLDNALEACRKLDGHREIDIKLLCQEGGVSLSVRNPLPPEDSAPRQDALLHGFGLQTVDWVLRRHQMPYAITREYGWFQFTAMSWPTRQEG